MQTNNQKEIEWEEICTCLCGQFVLSNALFPFQQTLDRLLLLPALLVLDATAGVTEQDRILAQKIADDGRACAIICNKWDAVVDKDSTTYDNTRML